VATSHRGLQRSPSLLATRGRAGAAQGKRARLRGSLALRNPFGLGNTSPYGITPVPWAAKIERRIREVAQALISGDLENARAGTIGLLQVVAEKPVETAQDQPPGSLISAVLGQGPRAEAASSSAHRSPESLFVTVSPKSRAGP
jgi:hypothetical protein